MRASTSDVLQLRDKHYFMRPDSVFGKGVALRFGCGLSLLRLGRYETQTAVQAQPRSDHAARRCLVEITASKARDVSAMSVATLFIAGSWSQYFPKLCTGSISSTK